jgi:hypothetical protein
MALPALVLPQAVPTMAWGLSTHTFMVSEAMEAITNESWYDAFELYSPEVLSGCTTPDQAWQDWDNHLYYPETGNQSAPQAAQHWFDMAKANFTAGQWVDGFFAAGVMTHYFADPCIPVHTDEFWPGHTGYEHDINENLETLTLESPSEILVDNVSQYVIDCATYSHQFYDDIYAAYEDEESRALDNATIKALTEDCLSMAINGCLRLFYTLQQYAEPPDTSLTYEYRALIDYAHGNDYIDDEGESQLTSLEQTLEREGFNTSRQTEPFSAETLNGIDLVVITCAHDSYTSTELSALASWAASGNHSLLLTSRGDFSTYTDITQMNAILTELGALIRGNHDNVYMEGTYQPWYNDLTSVPDAEDTLDLTENVTSLTLFSPTSLYFLDENPVLPLAFADVTGYQTDQTDPAMAVKYDTVQDGEYGNQIPLVAVEEVGSLRLLVSGTTFFSNFDYGKTSFDNVNLLKNFLEWAMEDREVRQIGDVDEIGPRISDPEFSYDTAEAAYLMEITVTDVSSIDSVVVEFETTEGTDQFALTLDSGDLYSAQVPADATDSEYLKVTATDAEGNAAVRVFSDTGMTTTTTTTTSTTTSTSPPPGLPIEMIVIVGVTALAVIVVIFLVMKRRA